MSEQRHKDLAAVTAIVLESMLSGKSPVFPLADIIESTRAAARKEALERDPVLRLMRHPRFRDMSAMLAASDAVDGFVVRVKGKRSPMGYELKPFHELTPEAAAQAALDYLEATHAAR